MKFRPMLAASFENPQEYEAELVFLNYPVLCSPKIDGIRFMKPPGSPAMSRSWTPLPNQRFQEFMTLEPMFNHLDGEVITGSDPTLPGIFNQTQSAIMTRDDDRPFSLWFFDRWENPTHDFAFRTNEAADLIQELRRRGVLNVNYVEHQVANNPQEVLKLEADALDAGFEGLMIRSPGAPYKFGRSTLKQQGLIKVKRYTDAEATVVGFEELERNQNEQTRNAFGLAKRSSHRAGKVAAGTLGKLILESPTWGQFACGSGLDYELRDEIWQNQERYLGKTVTFKFQAHGTLEKPRTPIFKGFREE